MLPETTAGEAAVLRLLGAVAQRLLVQQVLRALTAGLLVAAPALALVMLSGALGRAGVPAAIAAGVVVAGWVFWRGRAGRSTAAAALTIERAIPESRNVVLTAGELIGSPGGVAPWMRQRVIASAAAIAEQASVRAIIPLIRPAAWLALAAGVLGAVSFDTPRLLVRAVHTAATRAAAAAPTGAPGRLTLTATVTPPAYTTRPPRTVADPAQLDIIQGSRVTLVVSGARSTVRYGNQVLPVSSASGHRQVELVPDESGYFAIESEDGGHERRLLPVSITPDRVPTIRLDAPGKDLLMPDARRTIPVTASASDDFGLAALQLRYTKVSGTGEQFEFVEGTLPLTTTRGTPQAWSARGTFDLAALALGPGDSLVYRAVAHDARPGEAGAATSDTFFIEVAGPGQVALPGFELPPDRERYAYSQQMIVLKLERLRPREASLAKDALATEISTIEAEQRAVRANFIFLMGGHVEDEEEEAAQSNEIQEGRLENSARREINTAIRFMSQVEQALASADTAAALPPARSAVDALQRAFGRNRYFLRTLAVRSRIDPTRRLTGDLKEAADWRRLLEPSSLDSKSRQARALLTRLLQLAPGGAAAGVSPATLDALAEQALGVDPGNLKWQQISASLIKVRDALAAKQPPDVVRLVMQEALTPLLVLTRQSALRGADRNDADPLHSVWTDEARRR